MNNPPDSDAIRIDKWLWYARVIKTRTLARKLVEAGKVRINREKGSSASRLVRPGDVLTVVLERKVLVYEILALASRRGPYAEASQLYLDRSPVVQAAKSEVPADRLPRPGKHERRALAKLRGKDI